MEDLRIAMICMNSRVGAVGHNLDRMLGFIDGAASKDSDIICFPEMSLTGYGMPQSYEHLSGVDSEEFRVLVDKSRDDGIIICFGMAEQGGYITQFVVEDGHISGSYSKTHLGRRESGVFVQGDSLDVIRTSKAVLGIQLCWESHFPDITGTYASKGADIVLMPHASGLSGNRRREIWDRILPARAYDNSVFVASCNMVGDNGVGTVFGGGATIFDPRGTQIASDYSGECILMASLDASIIRDIKNGDGSTMKDMYYLDRRRPEIYYR